MEYSPNSKFSNGFLSLIAILLAFFALIAIIWMWYDLRLTSLEQERKIHEQTISPAIP